MEAMNTQQYVALPADKSYSALLLCFNSREAEEVAWLVGVVMFYLEGSVGCLVGVNRKLSVGERYL